MEENDMRFLTIGNDSISVEIDEVSATLHSIKKDGVEYLWQGDEKYWKFQDKNLFPYIGRMTDEKYICNGKEYSMKLHGFCGDVAFLAENVSETSVDFVIRDSEYTRSIYPFCFELRITYSVEGNKLLKKCAVTNRGTEEMYFGIGSHPGFNVPIGGEGTFEDWYFEFDEESTPIRIGFDQTNYRLNDENLPYALEEGKKLRLEHAKFDLDAIVLQGMPKAVTLRSDTSAHAVRAEYPDMDFLGLWHKPHSDAPYVCIEPWKSLPSHSGYVEDITKQEHIVHLPAGQEYTNTISFEII